VTLTTSHQAARQRTLRRYLLGHAEEETPDQGVRVPVLLIPGVLVLFGLFMLAGLRDLDLSADTGGPGPGFLPAVSGGCIVVLAVLLGIREHRAARRADAREQPPAIVRNLPRLVAVTLAIIVGTALWAVVGAIPAIALTIWWILKVIEGQSWLTSTVAAVAISLAMFVTFEVALDIPLPGRLAVMLGL